MQEEKLLIHNEPLTIQYKMYDQLTLNELYDITNIRQQVFVVEQACAFIDSDGFDKQALHIMILNQEGKIIAYSRILDKNVIYKEATIGRVLTHENYRNKGVGRILFEKSIHTLVENFGIQPIKIQAQSYLVDFYKTFGFEIINEAYLDTGIYHNDMIKYV